MTMIATGMIAVLATAAAIHILWGLKIWWPIRDEAALARLVVGTKGIKRMPKSGLAFAVAGLLFLGMFWTAALAGWLSFPGPTWALRLGGWSMAAILLLRGAMSWMPPFGAAMAEPEFRRLNERLYGPLIVALGLGVLALL